MPLRCKNPFSQCHEAPRPLTWVTYICSDCRIGGLLSGKAGLLYCHMGSGPTRLQPLRDAVAASDVPISQFLPTHMERSQELAAEGLSWLRDGGSLDFTAGTKVGLSRVHLGPVRCKPEGFTGLRH